MAEVAKPIIIANAAHQGLQRSYFSIRYLFFQIPVNQKYALSYHINFICYVQAIPLVEFGAFLTR